MAQVTLYPSAPRTVTPAAAPMACSASALYVVIDVTAAGVTPSVVVSVDGVDALTGKLFSLLASSAITAVGTTVLKIGPGITAAANLAAALFLPETVQVTVTHGNAITITYSVSAHLIK